MLYETRLYAKRWLVVGAVMSIAIQIGFTSAFLGVLAQTLQKYYRLKANVVDWFSVGVGVGVIIGTLAVGFYSAVWPVRLKPWLLTGLLVPAVAYIGTIFSLILRKYPGLIIFAQIFDGIAGSSFLPVVNLACSTWFGEREQATVYGLAWSSFGIGNLLASIIPTIILKIMKSDITQTARTAGYVYIAMSGCTFLVFLAVLVSIPKLPEYAPSQVEAERRRNSADLKLKLREQIRSFGIELKMLFTKRAAVSLLTVSSLSFALNVNFYLLMPAVGSTSMSHNLTNQTVSEEMLNATKAFTLIWFTVGTILGGSIIGIAMDKAKSYHPLAGILSASLVIASLVLLLAFLYSEKGLMNGFAFVFGVLLLGIQAFSGEVLKQYAFKLIRISTHAVSVTLFANISQVIVAVVGRVIINGSSNKYFFVYYLVCCVIMGTLLLSINPPQNRFLEEQKALLADSKNEVKEEKDLDSSLSYLSHSPTSEESDSPLW